MTSCAGCPTPIDEGQQRFPVPDLLKLLGAVIHHLPQHHQVMIVAEKGPPLG